MSLGGSLLRLMMTGLFVITPPSFWVQFFISEVVGYLSSHYKEVFQMIIKVKREVKSLLKELSRGVITSLESYLPYRYNLLMIW